MNAIRVLAVSPYEDLANLIEISAQRRSDIEVTVFIADLNEGAQIVQQYQNNGYDAILSRGGTAKYIEKVSNLPIVEIPISVYDVLRVVWLAQGFASRFAIVGFQSITHTARLINDILNYHIHICTIKSESEALACLVELRQAGYDVVIGDQIVVTEGRRLGFHVLLTTSGVESINEAFEQVIHNCEKANRERFFNTFYTDLIHTLRQPVIVYDEEAREVFLNFSKTEYGQQAELMQKNVPAVLQRGEVNLKRVVNDDLWNINGRRQVTLQKEYAVFTVSRCKIAVGQEKARIWYLNQNEIDMTDFEIFYDSSAELLPLISTVKKQSLTKEPILLLGQTGTGKDFVATALYKHSCLHNSPLAVLDCAYINGKAWDFILNDEQSPFAETNQTIFFDNLHALTPETAVRLQYYIRWSSLHKRNRLLFSFNPSDPRANRDILHYLQQDLGCLTSELPPLNRRTEEIPRLCNTYLHYMNQNLVIPVSGVSREAIFLLQQFNWQYNIKQFKKVLKHLVTFTGSTNIEAGLVRDILLNEGEGTSSEQLMIPLRGSLEDMEQNIIRQVLNLENQNQTRAADRLGIGRSTLWRKLKAES